MIRWPILLLAAWALPAMAGVSEAPEAVAVTVYRIDHVDTASLAQGGVSVGLGMITETRTIDLPAGRSVIAFRGVADGIVAETAKLDGLDDAVVERNADYDLLSPGSLLEKSVGRAVRVVRTDRATGKVTETAAVVRSGADGAVLEIDGRFEAPGCSGMPERLIFDQPPGLVDKPTLSMTVDAPRPGRRTVRLSYLTTGMTWSADYVARLRPDGRTLDLTGWITLANQTGATFAHAPTQVVAGRVNRDDSTRPIRPWLRGVRRECWSRLTPPAPPPPAIEGRISADIEEIVVTGQRMPGAPKRLARQEDLGDYKLYTLPEPTTVAARQMKQVQFLDQEAVPYERVYRYRLDDEAFEEDARPLVRLKLQNRAESGLGKPLPAGTVAVMASDGRAVLAGEDRWERDTPIGLPMEINLGRALDVDIAPVIQNASAAVPGASSARDVTVEFINRKTVPIVVEYRQPTDEQDFELVSESRRSVRREGDLVWTTSVAAGGHESLTYRIANREGAKAR